jgi:hypothetical protein
MSQSPPEALLRELVREILREVIREELGQALTAAPARPAPAASPRAPAPASGGVHRIERGAVPERAVNAAAAAGARLVIGPRAVLTPLARDRARVLGIVIERTA